MTDRIDPGREPAEPAPGDGPEHPVALVSEPAIEHVLECVFDIQPHEFRTYLTLVEMPGATVAELEAALDRDRSTVNRALLTLQDLGLVTRERRMLETGGYVYQYMAIPVEETRSLLHSALDRWAAIVHDRIDTMDRATIDVSDP